MFPEIIFRNTKLPGCEADSLQLDELRILDNIGSGAVLARTSDRATVAEVIDCLKPGAATFRRDPVLFQAK